MSGWISLHRSLLDHKLWKAEPFTKGQAWVDILLLTNHSDQIMTVKNGTMVEVKRGQCGYSELALGDRWKWSRGKVKRFLAVLSNQKMIHQKKVDNRTIIIVCNYEGFQTNSKQDSKRTVNGHLTGQQTDINNNENNENHENNIPDKSGDSDPLKKFSPEIIEFVKTFNGYIDGKFSKSAPRRTAKSFVADCNSIRLAMATDKFSLDDIKSSLRWAHGDAFWQDQIKSLAQIRKKGPDGTSKLQKIYQKAKAQGSPQPQMSFSQAAQGERCKEIG